MSNKIGLQAAIERLHDPKTDWSRYDKASDQKNIAHAQKTGLISRDPEGYIVYKDPTRTNIDPEKVIMGSKLDDWKNSTKMLDDLEKLIKRKEEILQPTTEEEKMWRGMIKDTTPFGAVRDNTFYETVDRGASFENQNLRQLSPADQSSIRASRDAAAMAHLGGIASERQYIGAQASDVMKSIANSINEKIELEAARIKAAAAAAGSGSGSNLFSNANKVSMLTSFPSLSGIINDLDTNSLADLWSVHSSLSGLFKGTGISPKAKEGYMLQFLESQENPDAPINGIGLLESAIRKGSGDEAANIFKGNSISTLEEASGGFGDRNVE